MDIQVNDSIKQYLLTRSTRPKFTKGSRWKLVVASCSSSSYVNKIYTVQGNDGYYILTHDDGDSNWCGPRSTLANLKKASTEASIWEFVGYGDDTRN